jgi:hypothetical protein
VRNVDNYLKEQLKLSSTGCKKIKTTFNKYAFFHTSVKEADLPHTKYKCMASRVFNPTILFLCLTPTKFIIRFHTSQLDPSPDSTSILAAPTSGSVAMTGGDHGGGGGG